MDQRIKKSPEILITPKSRVGELLEKYPELESTLLDLAPAFQKLKNPVIRKTIGKVATLQQAAKIGNIPVSDLVNALRKEIGQDKLEITEKQTDTGSLPPVWLDEANITVRFDATPLINSGENPMQHVLNHVGKIREGDIFLLITPFVPAPIIDIISKKGYTHFSRQVTGDEVHTFFTKV